MPTVMKFKGFDAFKISSVFLITEFKNGAMFKTKFLGHSLREDVPYRDNIFVSSVSTKISIQDEFEITILSKEEILNMVNNYVK